MAPEIFYTFKSTETAIPMWAAIQALTANSWLTNWERIQPTQLRLTIALPSKIPQRFQALAVSPSPPSTSTFPHRFEMIRRSITGAFSLMTIFRYLGLNGCQDRLKSMGVLTLIKPCLSIRDWALIEILCKKICSSIWQATQQSRALFLLDPISAGTSANVPQVDLE